MKLTDAQLLELPDSEVMSLQSTEKEWIARRIQQHGAALRDHPAWRDRLHHEIDISVRVEDIAELIRVLDAYARVALVTSTEAKRLRPSSAMPKVWDDQVSWAQPPQRLPDPWLRYRVATPPVCPRWSDGQLAW